jgi:hypothetical protein
MHCVVRSLTRIKWPRRPGFENLDELLENPWISPPKPT